MQTEREKRQLYVSTGTMVGRSNGYDYRRALEQIRRLQDSGHCDGIELMMLKFYYDKIVEVTTAVKESGVFSATIHCEKDIGSMISDAGVLDLEGNHDEAETKYREAVQLFRLNCTFAERLHITRMVLHLWGGISSDRHIEYNISKLPELNDIASEYGVKILCENIPSNHTDPQTNWHKLLPYLGKAGLIFDTRFGKLHEQTREILTDDALIPHIEHIHISDFAGTYRDFSALRPILHPGEGTIDFSDVAQLLNDINYRNTITLESPVMVGEALDIEKIERTLEYLRKDFS